MPRKEQDISTAMFNQKERLKKYGVIHADRLSVATRYYFDARLAYDRQAGFPRNFLYKGKLVSDTIRYDLPFSIMDAIAYTWGVVVTDYTAWEDRLNPRFAAEIRFLDGADGVLYVWGWNAICRLYVVLDRPYQFILKQ